MSKWLKDDLSGYQDELAVLYVAKTNDSGIGSNNPVSPQDLDRFQAQKGISCPNCLFLDGDRDSGGFPVFDKFVDANPYRYTAAVPMVLNKKMEIMEISGTYDWQYYPLDTILECLESD